MIKPKEFWKLVKEAGSESGKHKILKLSASLCFYAIFSIGPIMLVIVYISNIFFTRQAVEGTIYNKISGFIGSDAAFQIQELIKNTSLSNNAFMAVIGFAMLFVAATTVFTEIQDSMNSIWDLKIKKNKDWQQTLKNRMISFLIITALGFWVLLFLIVNSFLEGFMIKLQEIYPKASIQLFYAANLLLTLVLVVLFFAFTYKVLPDIYIQWKYVLPGALFAGILFMLGKFGLTVYINHSNMSNAYSSAGSFVVLLLWIYYSATILYFGAGFTKVYALNHGKSSVKYKQYAEKFKIVVDYNE